MTGLIGYNFGSKERRQNVMLNSSYQKANNKATYAGGENSFSDFYTSNLSYSYALVPQSMTLATSLNYYTSKMTGVATDYWGPTIIVTKGLFEKTLRTSISSSLNKSRTNYLPSSSILNNRLSLNYTPKGSPDKKDGKGRHTLSLGINVLHRFKGPATPDGRPVNHFTEFTSNFSWGYDF